MVFLVMKSDPVRGPATWDGHPKVLPRKWHVAREGNEVSESARKFWDVRVGVATYTRSNTMSKKRPTDNRRLVCALPKYAPLRRDNDIDDHDDDDDDDDDDDVTLWSDAFRRPRGCPNVAWSQYHDRTEGAGESAFSTAKKTLDALQVPSSLNRAMFSTWGQQWVFLDGFAITRDEPEVAWTSPIYGVVIGGPMALRYVCHLAGIPQPKRKLAGETMIPTVAEMERILAWQLEHRRPVMEQLLASARKVSEGPGAQWLYNECSRRASELLPGQNDVLSHDLVVGDGGGPIDLTDIFTRFEDRLPIAELWVSLDDDDVAHIDSRSCKQITGTLRCKYTTVGAIGNQLCIRCALPLICLVNGADEIRSRATKTVSPGRLLYDRWHNVSSETIRCSDNILRWSLRHWMGDASLEGLHGAVTSEAGISAAILVPDEVAEVVADYISIAEEYTASRLSLEDKET